MDITSKFTCMITYYFTCHFTLYYMVITYILHDISKKNSPHQARTPPSPPHARPPAPPLPARLLPAIPRRPRPRARSPIPPLWAGMGGGWGSACFTNKITCVLHGVTCSGIHYMDITSKFTCMITNYITCHFTWYYMVITFPTLK